MDLKGNLMVGIDIGGTFTDFVVNNKATGELFTYKSLSTPSHPSVGILQGLRDCFEEHNLEINDVKNIVHGTTLITNSIIERKGSKTGLITTKGFKDVLDIGRELRYDLYDLFMVKPEQLVMNENVYELDTREKKKLDENLKENIINCMNEIVNKDITSVAISLLYDDNSEQMEQEIKSFIEKKYPDVFLSVSTDVKNELGEYERTSTVVANAYVKPIIYKYIDELESGLTELGFDGGFFIMLSSGGFCTPEIAKTYPIRLLESGPAAGALTAAHWGKLTGNNNVIGFDMGGTTAKAVLIKNNIPNKIFEFETGRVHRFKKGSGLPILITAIDLIEIGAGGGSIASIDELGLLKIGPQSAGSEPGPACYSLGGEDPTVTDANILLGYLNADFFLGGKMTIDKDLATDSIRNKLKSKTDLDTNSLAWGIHQVVNENMSQATRIYAVEKGEDHRKYTIVATGGGGPIHAFGIAKNLNINKIIYPFAAGVSSAIGMLVVPGREDISVSFLQKVNDCDWGALRDEFAKMSNLAIERLQALGIDSEITINFKADIQYNGQGNTVTVNVSDTDLKNEDRYNIISQFEKEYEHLYSSVVDGGIVEFVNLRVEAETEPNEPEFSYVSHITDEKDSYIKGERKIYIPSENTGGNNNFKNVPVIDRYKLHVNDKLEGPCIIEENESTIVINGEAKIKVDKYLNIIAEMAEN